jgi:hypothetical protein
VTTVKGALEIGQSWDPLSPVTDVVLPMVYPSHYPRGAFGIDRPNADPYGVVYAAISKAHERDLALGISGEHVRTWIQAFTYGAPPYGAREVKLQKQAIYDAGYDGWILWHPGTRYGIFEAALERETVSRKKDWKPGTPASPPPGARLPDSAATPKAAAPVKLPDATKADAPVKAADTTKAAPPVKVPDTTKAAAPVQARDTTRAAPPVRVPDTTKAPPPPPPPGTPAPRR